MKTLLALLLSLLLLSACQKKQCWQCDASYSTTGGNTVDTVYRIYVCDKTKKEISQFESDLGTDRNHDYFLIGKVQHTDCH